MAEFNVFRPSKQAEALLRNGRMIDQSETPQQMIDRVVATLFDVEVRFSTSSEEISMLKSEFKFLLSSKKGVMSTPVMTNAGRYKNKPLSACIAPRIDLSADGENIRTEITRLHHDGMGTGFNLDTSVDPIGVLRYLNIVAVESAMSGMEDRPVGNMAILSSENPEIMRFISIKKNADIEDTTWKFNLSVNASDRFMNAVLEGGEYKLKNGVVMDARKVFDEIVDNAHACGDPGLIFMHRFEKDNPVPKYGKYDTVAPCAEVGLMPGEACQFGYINLGAYVTANNGVPAIDYLGLQKASKLMIRALDNALEVSIPNYPESSRLVMRAKRKIGIGICGLADMLAQLSVPYDSPNAREIAVNAVAHINYHSKIASHNLARARGSFEVFDISRYADDAGYIEQKYGNLGTATVTKKMWEELGAVIRSTACLRNATTITLPPTGRSGLVIDASLGVEPFFSLVDEGGSINRFLMKDLERLGLASDKVTSRIRETGSVAQVEEIPVALRDVYKTAVEIPPRGHIDMAAALQAVVDDAISKTINVSGTLSAEEIKGIYIQAYSKGMKGITIFRDRSRAIQPKRL